ncbi:beta-N-acetylhexosaminidase [Vibrio nigripulchritudo]|uniref:beta-N-acetylhexosaminidase n=1 Tax=Vibrio nigripulchritudo TaxID=28173 RepID=UPI0024915081|nr:beta-N-acetylhexosaminidase [Vibrio nigripulchritudo]BDU39719.1 beta-N-acetylhexosaminidase [Vibrio nigripulchritudo]BDU45442.1 beta-N-acetylhexosaminidase [Vibrio nigripulchritudo]
MKFKVTALTMALALASSGVHAQTQQDLKATADSLNVSTSLVVNQPTDSKAECPWGLCYRAEITITNTSDKAVNKDWDLYFPSIHRVLDTRGDLFTITHIDGDLHRVSPTAKFNGLQPGESVTVEYDAEYWQIVNSDFMPNYYISADGLKGELIKNTAVKEADTGFEDLSGFLTPISNDPADTDQWRRTADDKTNVATAGSRFEKNSDVADLGQAAVSAQIVPTPVELTIQTGTIDIAAGLNIKPINNALRADQVEAVNARLAQLGVATNAGVEVKAISNAGHQAFVGREVKGAYTLKVDATGVTVVGRDNEGVFNGLQSLASLVTVGSSELPKVTVDYDAPRFDYRGMHMDVSRNFQTKEQVLKFLDQMAAYKMNKFHFHLADDEGWRLEIPGLPELTGVGAKRCHDLDETTCLLPQLGSGPDAAAEKQYYSVADYAEILAYANARNIQVIPSMDMPGHSKAAVVAMEARYKTYAAQGDLAKAEEFLLTDPNDTTKYFSVQNYTNNTINPCMESSFKFMDKVIGEIVAQHNNAGQPLTDYHIGADETAGAWVESPICQQMFAVEWNGINNVEDLGPYFIQRISWILEKYSLTLAAWNDGLKHGEYINPYTLAGDKTSAYAWSTLFWGGANETHTIANTGYEVVVSAPDTTYFDFPYEVDPAEPGYYWGSRETDTREVFGFMPENLPANSETLTDRMGAPMTYAAADGVALNKNFKGIQGHLWSETIRTARQQDFMAFPRLLAMAERAWSKASWELDYDSTITFKTNVDGYVGTSHVDTATRDAEWEVFANTLGYKEFAKLDQAGVYYRLPVPGAKIEGGKLVANSAFPGVTIQYSTDGTTWQNYDAANQPAASVGVKVRTVAANGRVGRSIDVK